MGVERKKTVATYLRDCLQLLNEKLLADKLLQWRVPTSVLLCATFAAAESDAAWTSFASCRSALGGRLHSLSLCGHGEIDAEAVQALRPTRKRASLLWSPELASVRASLCVLDLSGSTLGDGGVLVLMELLFPTAADRRRSVAAPSTSRASSKAAAPAQQQSDAKSSPEPARGVAAGHNSDSLLPSLQVLVLDAVGLSDAGVEGLCAHLESLLHLHMCDSNCAASSADAGAVLAQLSLRRNDLSCRGVMRVLSATLPLPQNSKTPSFVSHQRALTAIGNVDVSWNSCVPRSLHNDAETKRGCFTAFGAALVASRFPPPSSSESCNGSSLLLRGCSVDDAGMHALWVEGTLSAYLDRFRDAGKAELLRTADFTFQAQPKSRVGVTPCTLWTSVTRIDLSHNAAMGSGGILHFLHTLLSLEAARTATTSAHHPEGLVPHPLSSLEELALRNVGCNDAALQDVVRLLLGDDRIASAVIARVHESSPPVLGAGKGAQSSEDGLSVALRKEAHALAGLRAQESGRTEGSGLPHSQEPPNSTEDAERKWEPFVFLPHLQLLDLSQNCFTSHALVATVMTSAMIRSRHYRAAPETAVKKSAVPTSATPDGDHGFSFTLVLEHCGVSDAVLDAVPLALESTRDAFARTHRTLAEAEAFTAQKTTSRQDSAVCALFLGDNTFTHHAATRLRLWAHQEHARGTTSSQKTAIRIGIVVAYVEGNAVVHTSVFDGADSAATGAKGSTSEEAFENGLSVVIPTEGASLFPVSLRLFLREAASHVSWSNLPFLPHFSNSSSLHERHAPRGQQRQSPRHDRERTHFTVQTTRRSESPQPVSPPPPPLSNANTTPPDRWSAAAVKAASPAKTVVTDSSIDEFIAEAEQIMSERAHLVRHTHNGSVVADVLSQLPSATPENEA
ncbi:hypothetical protein ABB37_01706 [Leptomonas pyrrhocoris]|uniref:Leucine-rich repeat protein n=1 Tax=Leptomonas pyrrhocoris TaxID=157538 RepID=A0A0N1J5D8_LEPPY|nr:hypothetical protein ABB37_01706 [Leptomonas pyrrhocoris]KPA85394.1 hypothetical protein ABB37_01706 [Leptomonas pyrrhocoris]|eukprot:XP_015663833.1 hypothetical protein ABB37_01706 [Leptomonas pyrrhocoris]